jgi:ribosomal protein S18 acetylase RimI-like enzyme
VTAPRIRPLQPADADACDAIVLGLPYHFGHEAGREGCAAAVRRERGLVAVEGSDVVGFLTFVPRFDETTEVTWMAVRADRRGRGIGHALISSLEDIVRADGRRAIVLLTVSPNDPDPERPDGYGATRAFYRSMGFILVRELEREWESDLAVMMLKPLDRATI